MLVSFASHQVVEDFYFALKIFTGIKPLIFSAFYPAFYCYQVKSVDFKRIIIRRNLNIWYIHFLGSLHRMNQDLLMSLFLDLRIFKGVKPLPS